MATKTWDEYIKKHQEIGTKESREVGSKESREKLHDTSKATDRVEDWRSMYTDILDGYTKDRESAFNKLVTYFEDTLVEFQGVLSGEEMHAAFIAAATQLATDTKKQYDTFKEVLDLLTGKEHEAQ